MDDELTPQSIGIKVGRAVIAFHADDGVNGAGDKSGKKYKKIPYSDYTGYRPINDPYELIYPAR